MLKRVHDNRVGSLFCHPELVSGSRFWFKALPPEIMATEVAPTRKVKGKCSSIYARLSNFHLVDLPFGTQ
jgi:hypothetical protein